MAIYTGGGDAGETHLVDGSRTSKASARVEAYGTIDEAGAAIGFARQAVADEALDATLRFAQQRLFNCASALADPADAQQAPVVSTDVTFLEAAIDRFSETPGGWRGFILASGGEASSRLHVARTVVRRAERRVVALVTETPGDSELLAFLNRLSDLLFVAARDSAAAAGAQEEQWDRDAEPPRL